RRSLQGGAGVKLYLTPSEQKTIEELSQAVGKTTKRVVTRSRAVGRNPFEGRSVSERTEDTPLLTEDQARRMDLDEVILVIDAQMPIRARRIKYFEDPALKVLHAGQAGSFPYPDEDGLRRDRQMTETRETVEKLKQELQEVRAAAGARDSGAEGASKAVEAPTTDTQVPSVAVSNRTRGRAASAAAGGAGTSQLSFDPARLGLSEADRMGLVAAVQTTRAIISEHS
ncbi:type IV secretory system conjugative DNA transfer family protein, partial [Tabrizicola sp.]|uniref:type IV secretory system conjugative DNA transfer family protein n=1 Tax=Tabrizicola sp. TaxID=2005166 RepID=UPI002734F003